MNKDVKASLDYLNAGICGRDDPESPDGRCQNLSSDPEPCPLSEAIEGDMSPCTCCSEHRKFCQDCI